ncbi:MAG TPA: hypothetical protein VMD30_12270 [Tepidisphaeraceae bacterium]|nr:hypothetical protein [Tepidisphaeraceae bacterium]
MSYRYPLISLVLIAGLFSTAARAATIVSVTPDSLTPGPEVPPDFAGVSCESHMLRPDDDGYYYFSPQNTKLIALYKMLGIRSLRIGGNSADELSPTAITPRDIDALYGFARAAGVKIIYTLRLKGQTDARNAIPIARYIMDHYDSLTTCFAVGNEANMYIHSPEEYCRLFKIYIDQISAVVPNARFCGSSCTPSKPEWAAAVARQFAGNPHLALITQHCYPGGNGRKQSGLSARDKILSPAIDLDYQKFYDRFAPDVLERSLPYRLEESNSYFHGGSPGASDAFASTLWGLDFMYWWASHSCAGINFHTGDSTGGYPMPRGSYSLFWTAPDGYAVHPLGYAVKAFSLAGPGKLIPMKVSSADEVNMTAYAVESDDEKTLTLTLINREHGPAARDALVQFVPEGEYQQIAFMNLTAPHDDVSSTSGVELGGAEITPDATWAAHWSQLPSSPVRGLIEIPVQASTAIIVKLSHD